MEMSPPRPARNVVGTIALVSAVVGFIFACIPGALIIGWILLPIGFVLGIVGLFMKARRKGAAIAAVIVAIVGTIVGVAVFVTVVGDAFDDAFGGDAVSVSGQAPVGPRALADRDTTASIGSRENPASIGATVSSGDWDAVVNRFDSNATEEVLQANPFNDEPKPGQSYGVANLTVTYRGDKSADANSVAVAFVSDGGNVFASFENFAVPPAPALSGELYRGASTTGNVTVQIPEGSNGLLRLRLGMFGNEVFMTTRN